MKKRTSLLLGITFLLGIAQADESTQTRPAQSEIHYVQPGDTLWHLSEEYLGDAKAWPLLQEANQIEAPRHMQPGLALQLPSLPPLAAEVSHRKGTAWLVEDDGERIPLRKGMTIAPGDIVETANESFVSLHLPHGEDVVLPSNSRIVVKRQSRNGTRLYLERGELEANVPSQHDHSDVLRIETPTSIIGVRGTHFRVTYVDDATLVSTLAGEVALSHEGQTISVPAGQGARSSAASPVQTAALLPAPTVQEGGQPFDRSLQINLSKVEGAVAYHVQLARDPNFRSIIHDKRDTSPTIIFDSVPQGFYYVRGSAFDSLGIEGHQDRQLILHRPIEASLEVIDDGYKFHWTRIPRLEYRLQLSEDATFSEPFMNRSFATSQGVTLRNLPTDDFFWRLLVSGTSGELADYSAVVASGRQGAARQP